MGLKILVAIDTKPEFKPLKLTINIEITSVETLKALKEEFKDADLSNNYIQSANGNNLELLGDICEKIEQSLD